MGEVSMIEWTDATWNPITGCSVLSPGCQHCYAMRLAGTRLAHTPSRAGLTVPTKAGPVWNGEVRFNAQWLDQPLRWRRPRMIFVCAHGDVFHEAVPDAWIDKVFAVMALAPQHTFQVLTKRSAALRAYLANPDTPKRIDRAVTILGDRSTRASTHAVRHLGAGTRIDDCLGVVKLPLPNVWLGVSAEDQQRADERIPHLLATPAAVRWLSGEPMLGALDLTTPLYHGEGGITMRGYLRDRAEPDDFRHHAAKLDWVVAGGESGPGARPMHPDWARSLRDQCAPAGVPFFFKQWGEWAPWPDAEVSSEEAESLDVQGRYAYLRPLGHMRRVGKKAAGRLLDGVLHDAMPEVRP